ncbi:MAG: hypothetical protein WA603_08700 [Candidatus Acidiferrales bacterium]
MIAITKAVVNNLFALLLSCIVFSTQTAEPVKAPPTFHVQGTVRSDLSANDYVHWAEVRFEGEGLKRTVSTDEKGFYEAELPLDAYTMAVEPLGSRSQDYQRPLFRALSPMSLTFNVTLDGTISCEPLLPAPGSVPADFSPCQELHVFPAPSADGTPFQIYIRFLAQWKTDRGYRYGADHNPVFVAYNLFTLRAERVVYDAQNRTIEATGNVIEQNVDGSTWHADAVTVKFENGQATPVQ